MDPPHPRVHLLSLGGVTTSSLAIGVLFPQLELASDREAVRSFALAAEDLGYAHIVAYEHVLGVAPRDGIRSGQYTHGSSFLEPIALYGFLAAITTSIRFATGVMVLPARQTALVAKQAATVDVLSGGRLRMGFGVGWNEVEFDGLNASFRDRGARIEEQIAVLRALWTQPLVDIASPWHSMRGVGISPMPVQRPIPIWIGGTTTAAMRRAARIGDGWFAQIDVGEDVAAKVARFRSYVADAGRDPAQIGVEWRLDAFVGSSGERAARAAWLQEIGLTHVHYNTTGAGLTVDAHVRALKEFRAAAGSLFE